MIIYYDEHVQNYFFRRNKITKDLKYEFYIAGSPEEVWKVIIFPEGTKQIYYGILILEKAYKSINHDSLRGSA